MQSGGDWERTPLPLNGFKSPDPDELHLSLEFTQQRWVLLGIQRKWGDAQHKTMSNLAKGEKMDSCKRQTDEPEADRWQKSAVSALTNRSSLSSDRAGPATLLLFLAPLMNWKLIGT